MTLPTDSLMKMEDGDADDESKVNGRADRGLLMENLKRQSRLGGYVVGPVSFLQVSLNGEHTWTQQWIQRWEGIQLRDQRPTWQILHRFQGLQAKAERRQGMPREAYLGRRGV